MFTVLSATAAFLLMNVFVISPVTITNSSIEVVIRLAEVFPALDIIEAESGAEWEFMLGQDCIPP